MIEATLRAAAIALILCAATVGYAIHDGSVTGSPRVLEGVIDSVSNPHLIAWVFTPIWLTSCLLEARVTRRAPSLIRRGSYLSALVAVARQAAGTLIVPAVSVLITSFSLHAFTGSVGVGPATSDGDSGSGASVLLAAGLPAGVGLLLQIGYLGGFFVVTRVVFEVCAMVFPFSATVSLAVACGLWAGASTTGLLHSLPATDFRSYTVLPAAMISGAIISTAATGALVTAAALVSATVLDRAARNLPRRVPDFVVVAAAACILIHLATFTLGTAAGDLGTHVFTIFVGADGAILEMLLGLALVVGYVFAAQFRLNEALRARAPLTLIRHGSRVRQLRSVGLRELGAAAGYSAAIALSAISAYLVAGGREMTFGPYDPGLLIFQLTVAQTLQLTFFLSTLAAVMVHFDADIAGLIAVSVIALVSAIPLPPGLFLPWQRSTSAGALPGGWPAALAGAFVLIIGIAIAVMLFVSPRDRRRRVRLLPLMSEKESV